MTKEEAIKVLTDYYDGHFIGHSSDEVNEALDMAISAFFSGKEIRRVMNEICEINIQDVTGTRERFHDVESYEVGEKFVNIYFKNGDEIIYFKNKVVLIEIIRDPEIMSK